MSEKLQHAAILPPRTGCARVTWSVQQSPSAAFVMSPAAVPAAFGAIRQFIEQLMPLANLEGQESLQQVRMQLQRLSDPALPEYQFSPSHLNADGAAFAILRRISRESVYTAHVIDRTARVVLQQLAISAFPSIALRQMDLVDRPSLKIFFRMLLLQPESLATHWTWHFARHPLCGGADSLSNVARRKLLATMYHLLAPHIVGADDGERSGWMAPDTTPVAMLLSAATTALLLQDYDRCILVADRLTGQPDRQLQAEGYKLLGIVAINIGEYDRAEALLRAALQVCEQIPFTAHLHYLMGLLLLKRRYAPDAAMAQFEAGMALLEAHRGTIAESEYALEMSWLDNGISFALAMRYKKSPTDISVADILQRLTRAFVRVQPFHSPACTYLRGNLIANLSFMLETAGDLAGAYVVLHEYYASNAPYAAVRGAAAQFAGLNYRLGVLALRQQQYALAEALLTKGLAGTQNVRHALLEEKFYRALGCCAMQQGAFAAARDLWQRGAEICRDQHSAEGLRFYDEYLQRFGADGMVKASAAPAVLLSPKLPAYLPEIDLEEMPAIDLNKYLNGWVPGQAAA